MKLAQALLERSDLQKRIAQLHSRLSLNAKVQEGERPAEEPMVLLAELDTVTAGVEVLITRINLTNAHTLFKGETLTALLARRDLLGQKVGILRDFLEDASATVMRGTRSEVILKSTVDVGNLRKQVDALSKSLRELDITIQEQNWLTELI